MSPKLAQVIAAGKALDADEREVAALAILHVDRDEQAAIDATWVEEVDRRVEDIVSGRVELVDGDETFRLIRAELAARRDS